MTKDEFLRLYERETTHSDKAWRNTALTENLCTQLLMDQFPPETLLLSHKLPVVVLQQLAQHSDPKVRRMVADKRAAAPILDTLANDEDAGVRIRVCYNAKASKETLTQLSHDHVVEVREAARARLRR